MELQLRREALKTQHTTVAECDLLASALSKIKRANYYHQAEALRVALDSDMARYSAVYSGKINEARFLLFDHKIASDAEYIEMTRSARREYHQGVDDSTRVYVYGIQTLIGQISNSKVGEIVNYVNVIRANVSARKGNTNG